SFGNKDNPCKSFAPNIFNKNKCQNCFRPRETHLKSDKDLNKAKPVYGGWLLLAPIGTDFSNLMHKNRKWQRRWFVLFEHGALRYALDDNMSTVAQGTLDMNKCTDVIYADSITDQKHSLCITLPDLRYFIRGESKEDIMGWHDQLVIYPDTIKEEKMMKKRFFKRKSEGPAKPQLPYQSEHTNSESSLHSVRNDSATNVTSTSSHSLADSTDGSQAGTRMNALSCLVNPATSLNNPVSTGGKKKQFKDYHNLADVPKAKRISNKHFKEKRKEVEKRSRARSPGREEVDRIFGRERRRSRVIEVFPVRSKFQSDNKENNEPPSPVVTDGTPTPHSVDTPTSTLVKSPPPTPSTPREPSTPRDNEDRRGRSISRRSTNMKQFQPDLFNVKKGWLTMLTDGVWKKHWFVLGDKSLRYYQDSTAEDTANVDGSIDLTTCSNVSVIEVQRNYGFKIQLANTDHHLAAMTAGIRRNWIRAIEKSSVPDATKEEDDTQSGKSETIDTSSKKSKDLEDLSVTERSQRRRARIRDRRREGRSRTFDFGEFRFLSMSLYASKVGNYGSADHIKLLQHQAEEQELEMREMQESYERPHDLPISPSTSGIVSEDVAVKLFAKQVRRLMQETEKVENARAELSKNTEQTLTRFKRKHEQELASFINRMKFDHDNMTEHHDELRQEQEKVLETREKLHSEQLEREKEIDVMREKPGDEQGSHEYQKQLEEIKELCDQSFHCIEETHSKQIEELISAHERELERLREEFSEERAIDKEDTKRAIDVMLKHHEEEISTMRSQLNEKQPKVGSTNGKLSREVEKLKTELETLSEHYSRKCVELANSHEHNQKLDDVVRALERENQRTQARNNELAGSLQAELRSIQPPGVGKEQQAGDLYQLEVMLRVKTSEIDYLKQEVDSINQQLEDCFEKRQVQKKHQTLFDELTLSRSKEAISRREVVRLKEQLRSTDEEGGGSGGEGRATSSGYDFQKSRSQPDFPPPSNKAGSSSVTSPVTSVKRRSSDRGNRSKI
uniref:PH domain-containing protein n=1 Tax=Ciona intestinalis TaxID=7719 RepID=F6ZPY0_CIOIN